MKRAFLILSAPEMFGFMKGQAGRLREMGYEATVLSSRSERLDQAAAEEGAARISISICRDIRLVSDVTAFVQICWHLFLNRPEAVILSGPKAIFLGGMAAWFVGIPCRIAVYHGMRQETIIGPKRVLLDMCDRVSFACATKVLAVSSSLRALIIERKLISPGKTSVIGDGSANGVNTGYFSLESQVLAAEKECRQRLGIPADAMVIGYVGRLTEDKGLKELYECFNMLRQKHADLRLLVVGPNEMSSAAGRHLLDQMCSDSGVLIVGSVSDVRPYYAMMSVHVFPSYREGFGMAVAEAAAMGIPTVAFDATGVRDSVANGVTGRLVPMFNVAAMASSTEAYLVDEKLRQKDGNAAMMRARRLYNPSRVWEEYRRALQGC